MRQNVETATFNHPQDFTEIGAIGFIGSSRVVIAFVEYVLIPYPMYAPQDKIIGVLFDDWSNLTMPAMRLASLDTCQDRHLGKRGAAQLDVTGKAISIVQSQIN